MIHYYRDMPRASEREPAGGRGEMTYRTLFEPADLGGRTGMFADVTLPAGALVGEHLHDSDCETFWILEGEAVLTEDGKQYPVSAGDIEFCPRGHSHGLENRTDRPVRFLALQFKGEVQP